MTLSKLLIVAVAITLSISARPADAGKNIRTHTTSGSVVALETNFGTIRIQLFKKRAPKTTANFLGYVKSGFYNGTVFHRVVPRFMIQGGGYSTAYVKKKTGAAVPNEATNGLRNMRGTVAAARTGQPHSATAQFFINLKDNPRLDHHAKGSGRWGWCVFGKVIKGMAVVGAIARVRTGRRTGHHNAPLTNIVIKKAYVVK